MFYYLLILSLLVTAYFDLIYPLFIAYPRGLILCELNLQAFVFLLCSFKKMSCKTPPLQPHSTVPKIIKSFKKSSFFPPHFLPKIKLSDNGNNKDLQKNLKLTPSLTLNRSKNQSKKHLYPHHCLYLYPQAAI